MFPLVIDIYSVEIENQATRQYTQVRIQYDWILKEAHNY